MTKEHLGFISVRSNNKKTRFKKFKHKLFVFDFSDKCDGLVGSHLLNQLRTNTQSNNPNYLR